MTQQINLYDSRLLPRHEKLNANNLGVTAAVLLAVVIALAVYLRFDADRKSEELSGLQGLVEAQQKSLTALGTKFAERRVSPALAGQLSSAQAMLDNRKAAMEVLSSGKFGNTTGFSAFMFGFSKLTQTNVWLTGFSVSMGGEEIEIRGRLLDPSKLPEYMKRLSSEPVFHGRRFAALDMRSVEPEQLKPDQAAVAKNTESVLPRFVEFVLRSEGATGSGFTETSGVKP